MHNSFALRGTFIDAPTPEEIRVRDGYAVCTDGICQGVFENLPEQYADLPVQDYSGRLILPGFVDLHLHAPQFSYCGTAMDIELLDWLKRYTFPEESHYKDIDYARRGYEIFVRHLKESMTTRACIFATLHTDATLELMRQLDESGLGAYVGKLAMNRNSPDHYREKDTETGLAETRRWLDACKFAGYELVHPMITPRFTPSVTDDYMEALGRLAKEYHLPAQSHLSENPAEVAWISKLCPDTRFYGETYSRYGLFGGGTPTVMAHCIYSGEEERNLMRENGVFIAHCPTSNENVMSGIAPAAMYLREGFQIGLGSDVAGGHTLNLLEVMARAIANSKLRWRYIDQTIAPLTLINTFYMATRGGGKFFGNVGLFEEGFAFDAVIPDETGLESIRSFTPVERLERITYLGKEKPAAKYVAGRKIL